MAAAGQQADLVATAEVALTGEGATGEAGGPRGARSELLHFALRNAKLVIGLSVVLAFLVLAIVGPWLTDATPFEFGYPPGTRSVGVHFKAWGPAPFLPVPASELRDRPLRA